MTLRPDRAVDPVSSLDLMDAEGWSPAFITVQDGFRLHIRDYRPRDAAGISVVCLPGLTRTGAEFHELARSLASDSAEPRRVIALDTRGRGGSGRPRPAPNYMLPIEVADVLSVLTALEIDRAVFVGTSRGGIVAMLLGSIRPTAIAGVVLNDVGPILEARGLIRIKAVLEKLPTPRTFEEGAEILRQIGASQFPKLGPADWLQQAKRSWTNCLLISTASQRCISPSAVPDHSFAASRAASEDAFLSFIASPNEFAANARCHTCR